LGVDGGLPLSPPPSPGSPGLTGLTGGVIGSSGPVGGGVTPSSFQKHPGL